MPDIRDTTLFKTVIEDYLTTASIKRTADRLHLSEVRVRRILITEGLWSSDTSLRVGHLFEQGLSAEEIAGRLAVSLKAIQQYMPYSRGLYGTDSPSEDAVYSAEYRSRIRAAQERVLKRKKELSAEEGWGGEDLSVKVSRMDAGREERADANREVTRRQEMSLTTDRMNADREEKAGKDGTASRLQEVNESCGTILEDTFAGSKELVQMKGLPEKGREEREMKNSNDEYMDRDMPLMENTVPQCGLHFPQYPGIVCFRELPEGFVDEKKRKMKGVDVIRLHLELLLSDDRLRDEKDDGHWEQEAVDRYDVEAIRVLQTYGRVRYGRTITRDILVPSDLPLYALHYAIQAAFGWENSHLHHFELPKKQYRSVTGKKTDKWMNLVGVLFRSPWMDDEDVFWADDYERGSFKNWLRKKYTGPYLSLCHGEGIIQSKEDMEIIKSRIPFVQLEYVRKDRKLRLSDASPAGETVKPGPVELEEGKDTNFWGDKIAKAEIVPLEKCPLEALDRLFEERAPSELLERLSLEEVLALHGRHPMDRLSEGEELLNTYGKFMDVYLRQEIRDILESGLDVPERQPLIGTPTDVLYYNYDFGDNWNVRITGSYDACDLVEQGRITDQELALAIKQVYETYRPVCIAADGLPLVDDAGGIHGYTMFLRALHPEEEKRFWEEGNEPDNGPYEDRESSLEWAKSLGFKERVQAKGLL